MADHAGRETGSVEQELYDDASRFTFLQAVRLMEDIELRKGRGRKPPGESVHTEQELVFFRHEVRLDLPSSDVESLERLDGEGQPTMRVNVLGLAGGLGPLPHAVTETILRQLRGGQRAFADFLDIFNHRLISLLHRARKKYRPSLDPHGPHEGRVSRVLYALLGLGTPYLRGRVLGEAQPRTGEGRADRPLLAYSGLFAERYRSPAGLERIIDDCFGVKSAIVPFLGAWAEVEENDRTAIGVKLGRNNRLGHGTLVGGRIWDQAARFEVRLGPLSLEQFRSFLPGAADAYRSLVSLIRFYAHEELGFQLRLVLRKEAIPRLHLKREGAAHLGHTTWLTTGRPSAKDDDQVRLAGTA